MSENSEIDFKVMVNQLAKDGKTILEQMTPIDAHVLHMAIGIAGEAGELLDAIKKAVIYRKAIDIDNVIEELGDLEFYMEGLRQGLDVTRRQTLDANIYKLWSSPKARYKRGYTDEAAQARADKA